MIERLDVTNEKIATQVLAVQIPSYQVEAELIGFYGIPQLKDTIETVQNSGETFYGLIENGEIIGVIAVEDVGEALDICRLVVHPSHFRKGVARKLVSFVLNETNKPITVSTGAKNGPAISLYEKHGFQVVSEIEVEPGFFLVQMFNPRS